MIQGKVVGGIVLSGSKCCMLRLCKIKDLFVCFTAVKMGSSGDTRVQGLNLIS